MFALGARDTRRGAAADLAAELLDDPTALVRLDMSEYAERHSVSRRPVSG